MSKQLSSFLEKLRSMEVVTSDSGAVSDFSEVTECKSHSCTSLTAVGEEKEEEEEGGESVCDSSAAREKDSAKVLCSSMSSEEKASVNADVQDWIDKVCKEINSSSQKDGEMDKGVSLVREDNKMAAAPLFVEEIEADRSLTHEPPLSGGGEEEEKERERCVGEERKDEPKAAAERVDTVRIKRKTKRCYGPNWRRHTGNYGNSRSRNQQATPPPASSFNHDEVIAFLWESKSIV